MEEDIKILEEYLEKDIPCDSCRYCGERPNVSKAVRNLIARYKELEQKCKIRKEIYNRDIKAVDDKWKSKVKEKIEKYKNKIDKLENKKLWNEPVDTINKNRWTNYINAYLELLED